MSICPSAEQWQELYDICQKQSMTGIGWYAIEKLPKEQRPQGEILFLWMGMARKIVATNELVIDAAKKVTRKLQRDGFDCCVLKGVGNVLYYNDDEETINDDDDEKTINDDNDDETKGEPTLGMYRSVGDIDVWMMPRENQSVIEYAKKIAKDRGEKRPKVSYLHTELPKIKGIEVEAHFRPAYMNSPVYNKRTMKWQQGNALIQMNNICEYGFAVPTVEFNMVYQLNHIFRHFIKTGIGLRQILDYYMVLKRFKKDNPGKDIMPLLQHLGLGKFAEAVMYVLEKVFNIEDSLLICNPNSRNGEILLDEIMRSGNFGKYDDRRIAPKGIIPLTLNIIQHDIRILRAFPTEVIFDPFFRIYHKFWQLGKWVKV